MNRIQHIATAVLIGLLAIWALLSAASAFLDIPPCAEAIGLDGPEVVFRSGPMAVFFGVLLALLALGFVLWPRLLRKPGLLFCHLGAILVIAGGMIGSVRLHNWQGKPAEFSQALVASETMAVQDHTVQLVDAWTDYQPTPLPWQPLLVQLDDAGEQQTSTPTIREDGTIDLGNIATLRVYNYLAEADIGQLVISSPDGECKTIPAEIGQTIVTAEGETLEIERIFRRIMILPKSQSPTSQPFFMEDPWGKEDQPTLLVRCTAPDGKTTQIPIPTPDIAIPMHAQINQQKSLMFYLPPAKNRHGLVPPPTMRLELSRQDISGQLWLTKPPKMSHIEMPLAVLYETPEAWQAAGQPTLAFVPPTQSVIEHTAQVDITAPDGETRRETIEVNHPLAVGDYDVYLTHIPKTGAAQLEAISRQGTYIAYAGFGLLAVGIVIQTWIVPLRRSRRNKEVLS